MRQKQNVCRLWGHQTPKTFGKHYISQNVKFNLQSSFWGRDAAKRRAVKTIGDSRDPRAPSSLTSEQRREARQQPLVLELQTARDSLRREIIALYGSHKEALPHCELVMKLQEANRALHTERIFQDRAKQKEIRDQYFATSHSITIKEQLSGLTSTDYFPPPRPLYLF